MTDYGRFMVLLDNIGIKYRTKEFEKHYYIDIGYKHIKQIYGNAITIEFDSDGNFITFEAWGE